MFIDVLIAIFNIYSSSFGYGPKGDRDISKPQSFDAQTPLSLHFRRWLEELLRLPGDMQTSKVLVLEATVPHDLLDLKISLLSFVLQRKWSWICGLIVKPSPTWMSSSLKMIPPLTGHNCIHKKKHPKVSTCFLWWPFCGDTNEVVFQPHLWRDSWLFRTASTTCGVSLWEGCPQWLLGRTWC